MVLVEVKVTRTGLGFTLAEWHVVIKSAWLHAIRRWFKEILPKHFTVAGAAEYRYQNRSEEHRARKRRVFGHDLPLVYSGRMKQEVLANQTHIVVTAKGGRAYLHGPKYMWMYGKAGQSYQTPGHGKRTYKHDQPNKARELTAVSRRDIKWMEKVMQEYIEREANEAGKRPNAAQAAVRLSGGGRAAS